MTVLKVNTFVFDFLSIIVESFSIGIVPEILSFVEWITWMNRMLIPGGILVDRRAVEGKLRPASCHLIHVLSGVIAAVLPLRKSCGWR